MEWIVKFDGISNLTLLGSGAVSRVHPPSEHVQTRLRNSSTAHPGSCASYSRLVRIWEIQKICQLLTQLVLASNSANFVRTKFKIAFTKSSPLAIAYLGNYWETIFDWFFGGWALRFSVDCALHIRYCYTWNSNQIQEKVSNPRLVRSQHSIHSDNISRHKQLQSHQIY